MLTMEVNLRVKRVNRAGQECDALTFSSRDTDSAHFYSSTLRLIFGKNGQHPAS